MSGPTFSYVQRAAPVTGCWGFLHKLTPGISSIFATIKPQRLLEARTGARYYKSTKHDLITLHPDAYRSWVL